MEPKNSINYLFYKTKWESFQKSNSEFIQAYNYKEMILSEVNVIITNKG